MIRFGIFNKVLVYLTLTTSFSYCANFQTGAGFYGQKYSLVERPRCILLDDAGDILVLSLESSRVISLVESENSNNGTVTVDQVLIVNGTRWSIQFNHGMAYAQGYLYASSDSTVYRWPYFGGQREEILTEPEIAVFNIPSGMRHQTREIVFDKEGRTLFVQVGSGEDVDVDSSRARIRSFDIVGLPDGGLDFEDGEVFADGVRNNVGLAIDTDGVLWGVDNGPGALERPDLGGVLTDGNPADELNKFVGGGTKHGFPYCFSSYELEGYPSGSQFAWPTFLNDGIHDDDWCRNVTNNVKPELALPDHSAAVGLTFFDGRRCAESDVIGSFPCAMERNAFVAFHGSNPTYKEIASGYAVKMIQFENGHPTGITEDVIFEPDTKGCRETPEQCFRPVDVIFDKDGHLIVSEDMTGEIFRVFYQVAPPEIVYGRMV